MRKHKHCALLGAFVAASCIMANSSNGDDGQDDDRSWYLADNKPGIPAEQIEPPSVPAQVRRAYRASCIAATRSNSWIVWVNAWPRNGGKDGRVYVESFSLEAIAGIDSAIPIHTQRYERGDNVWGGWFPFNDRVWYKLGMVNENAFMVGEYKDEQNTFVGAILNVGRHADIPAAGHIWMKRWPRDEAPPDTTRLRIRARFAATGSVFVNVGMDRYRLKDADPEPVQEVLVSDTYGAEHGIVDVVMETVPIDWQEP